MNNTVSSIWEWPQVPPMVTTHPLAMCMCEYGLEKIVGAEVTGRTMYGGGFRCHAPVPAV